MPLGGLTIRESVEGWLRLLNVTAIILWQMNRRAQWMSLNILTRRTSKSSLAT